MPIKEQIGRKNKETVGAGSGRDFDAGPNCGSGFSRDSGEAPQVARAVIPSSWTPIQDPGIF